MTTLRTQLLTCPHCQNKMYSIGVMSYTIRNSEVFSDGKISSNPPRPLEHNILICNACYKAFWKEDALINDDNTEDINELHEANNPSDLFPGFNAEEKLKRIHYYSELLEAKFANTKEREVYLRIELWRLLNDEARYTQKEITKSVKRLFDENLKGLIDIFNPKNDDEQLLVAEMYRELGEFDEALLILKHLKGGGNNQACLQIEEAVILKNSIVFKII